MQKWWWWYLDIGLWPCHLLVLNTSSEGSMCHKKWPCPDCVHVLKGLPGVWKGNFPVRGQGHLVCLVDGSVKEKGCTHDEWLPESECLRNHGLMLPWVFPGALLNFVRWGVAGILLTEKGVFETARETKICTLGILECCSPGKLFSLKFIEDLTQG